MQVEPDYFETFNKFNPEPIKLIGLKHINLKKASDRIRKEIASISNEEESIGAEPDKNIGKKLQQVSQPMQLTFFDANDPILEEIKDDLMDLDVNSMTPIEAMMKLNELKKKLD